MLFSVLLSGCGSKDSGLLSEVPAPGSEDQIHILLMKNDDTSELFRLGDQICMPGEAKLYLYNMQQAYQSVYGDSIWEKKAGTVPLEDKLKNSALSRITAVKTLTLMARDRGVELDDDEKKLAREAAVTYINSIGQSGLEKLELDDDMMVTCCEELMLADKVYRNILEETEPEISDDEARMVTVSQILLKTYSVGRDNVRTEFDDKQKAEVYQKALNILTEIKQGGDFDTIAATSNQADKITVSFGRDERQKQVCDAAFMLSQGEISRVIETDDGYLIMKCVQSFDREQTDLRKDEIARKKKEEAFARIYDDFSVDLLRSFNDSEWDSIHFNSSELSGDNFFDIISTLLK